jgi:hypothetical protein
MQIVRDPSIEDFVLKEIQTKLSSFDREGIHMSDLLAPKKAFWQKTNPLPATKQEIIYWLSGKAHESVFLYVSDLKHGEAKQWNGIWYTPDVFFNFPVEIKTTRRGFVPKVGDEAESFSYYLRQLRYYCTMSNCQQGWLIVWFLVMLDENRRQTTPDYFCYRVEFTDEDLKQAQAEINKYDVALRSALASGVVDALPDCEKWICYKETRNMVEKPFCITCNKEFQTDWGIDKHVSSKTGAGHKIRKAEYELILEPRCKYAIYCKPDMVMDYEEWKSKQPANGEEEDVG